VWFAIADYFAVRYIYVFWDVSDFDEETCVGVGDVPNTLEEVDAFVAKTWLPKWFEMGIIHECHVFLYFPVTGCMTAMEWCA
jgi:hypothetical protein